jgi:hypothetical protein
MSNQNNSFSTPPELIKLIKEFWGGKIDLDPCSNKNSLVKAEKEIILPQDGLKEKWFYTPGKRTSVFINPPYAPYYISESGIVLTPKEYNDIVGDRAGWKRCTIKTWLSKGEEKWNGCDCIYLIPARGSGSLVWQNIVYPCSDAICYLKKRIPFWENGSPCKGPDGKISGGTFDCALVYFGIEEKRFKQHFSKLGYVVIQDRS